jgi:hypothetical protein
VKYGSEGWGSEGRGVKGGGVVRISSTLERLEQFAKECRWVWKMTWGLAPEMWVWDGIVHENCCGCENGGERVLSYPTITAKIPKYPTVPKVFLRELHTKKW